MEESDSTTNYECMASGYDDLVQISLTETQGTIEALVALAAKGAVLELGIGTGRIALPLACRGLAVHGIDTSPSMVEALRKKPGGNTIPVLLGDFAEIHFEGRRFSLVYVVFNTLFDLVTQEAQARCFQAVAQSLEHGGRFVVEAFVLDSKRFTQNQAISAPVVKNDEVRIEVATHDRAKQRIDCRHILFRAGAVSTFTTQQRYAWPSELDLMARLAGLRLRERWSDWNGSRFVAESQRHISIYEL